LASLDFGHFPSRRWFHPLQWHPAEWREHEGEQVFIQPGFAHSTTSTKLIPACRPPSRAKPRHLDRFKLLCHAEAFVDAIKRGIQSGCI
jgi:hypothetical protein